MYFVLVLLALFIFPKISLFQVPNFDYSNLKNPSLVALYVTFMPNVALSAFLAVPFLAHTWFLGVLEQAYLIIILLLKRF